MSQKEFNILQMCIRIHEGTKSITDAATELQVSYRTIQRKIAQFRAYGESGLIHKARGTPSNHRIPDAHKTHVLELLQTHYKGYSASYASELLATEHSISISSSTLLRWTNTKTSITKKTPVYRARRPRMTQFGRLLQGDGSFHHWFGKDYPPCCLLVLIDDATNQMYCRFAEQEYAQDMLILLHDWITRFGIPDALYFDRRNAYVKSQRTTRYIPRVCDDLGVSIINASSPQAKGRVERVNRTLQDRLVKDLIRNHITSIDAANHYLSTNFIHRFNTTFRINPHDDKDAHVPLAPDFDLTSVFARQYIRKVSNDWTFSINGRTYQISNLSRKNTAPKQKICALHYLNNSFMVYSNNHKIIYKEV